MRLPQIEFSSLFIDFFIRVTEKRGVRVLMFIQKLNQAARLDQKGNGTLLDLNSAS